MTNILVLAEALPFHGGVPRSFLWLASHLPPGHFYFGSLQDSSDTILPEIEKKGAKVVSFGSRNRVLLWVRIRRFIKRNDIKAIFACSLRSYYMAKASAAFLDCDVVFWIRDLAFTERLSKRVLFHILSPGDWLLADSGAGLQACSGPERGRTAILYNGVETPVKMDKSVAREALQIPQDALVLLYAADFKSYKDHYTLIQAFKILADHWPNLYLVLCGREGALRKQIVEPILLDTPSSRRVLLYGARRDMGTFFSAADIYVHPCYVECFGNAVAEAMSAGLPVVVCKGGGLPEVVGDTGMLFEPRDYHALADGIERLLSDEAARSALGKRGAGRAHKEFSAAAFAERFLQVCDCILNEQHGG